MRSKTELKDAVDHNVKVISGERVNEAGDKSISDKTHILIDILNETFLFQGEGDKTMMNFKLNFILKKLIEEQKTSIRKVSKATGVPLSTLSGYLKPNRSQVDPEHLLRLAKYFSVSVDYLLTGKNTDLRLRGLATTKLFSRIVRLTIEDIEGVDQDEK